MFDLKLFASIFAKASTIFASLIGPDHIINGIGILSDSLTELEMLIAFRAAIPFNVKYLHSSVATIIRSLYAERNRQGRRTNNTVATTVFDHCW